MAAATETLKPPLTSVGALGWLRKNLFSTWYNALLTILALWIVYALVGGIVDFVRTANWAVVTTNLRLFMVGRYPLEETWRVQVSVSLLALLSGASWGLWRGVARTAGIAAGATFLTLAGLPFETNTRLWLAGNFALIALGYGIAHFARPKRLIVIAWLASRGWSNGAVGMPIPEKRRLISQAVGRFVVGEAVAEVAGEVEAALTPRPPLPLGDDGEVRGLQPSAIARAGEVLVLSVRGHSLDGNGRSNLGRGIRESETASIC